MWRFAISLVLIAALTGCGPMFESEYTGPGEGDHGYGVPEELQPLLERRDAEEVIADRDRMIGEITAELTRLVPGSHFVQRREPGESVCGDFGSTDGSIYFSPHYTSAAPIPAALWDTASQAVIDIAAEYGYTDAVRTENATDDQARNITITDAEGGRLTLNSMEATTFYVGTGCYLTAAKKQQARDGAPN